MMTKEGRILTGPGCVIEGMDTATGFDAKGRVEPRYLAFLEAVTNLRPRLHRYCARMTGSVLDGEDVVQEALFQAYRRLETFDDARALAPWLFRIAHNCCIDLLRRRQVREDAEVKTVESEDGVTTVEFARADLGPALEHLVLLLPPKERACVLLKDVFDYSLEEIADLVDSTVGGVKAALNRGRSKLAERAGNLQPARAKSDDDMMLMRLYVERFNAHDWDGLRELISADARLNVADRFSGRFADATYLTQYERIAIPWRAVIGEVDGESAIFVFHRTLDAWQVAHVVRLEMSDGRVREITDLWHCPWVLPAASTLDVDMP
jgi:RNA polymerase sigma-70 factor (ECF subfamily)